MLGLCPVAATNTSEEPIAGACRARLELVNGHGNQLSSDQMPLPGLLRAATLIWAGLMLLWFANWFYYRQVLLAVASRDEGAVAAGGG